MKSRRGFGLAEVIIIILVIGMFGAFAIGTFANNNKSSLDKQQLRKLF